MEQLHIIQVALFFLINLCIVCAGVWISVRMYGVSGGGGVCVCVRVIWRKDAMNTRRRRERSRNSCI